MLYLRPRNRQNAVTTVLPFTIKYTFGFKITTSFPKHRRVRFKALFGLQWSFPFFFLTSLPSLLVDFNTALFAADTSLCNATLSIQYKFIKLVSTACRRKPGVTDCLLVSPLTRFDRFITDLVQLIQPEKNRVANSLFPWMVATQKAKIKPENLLYWWVHYYNIIVYKTHVNDN